MAFPQLGAIRGISSVINALTSGKGGDSKPDGGAPEGGGIMKAVQGALKAVGVDLGSTDSASSATSEAVSSADSTSSKKDELGSFMSALFGAVGGGPGGPGGPPPGPPSAGGSKSTEGGQGRGPSSRGVGGYGEKDLAASLNKLAENLSSGSQTGQSSEALDKLKEAFGQLIGSTLSADATSTSDASTGEKLATLLQDLASQLTNRGGAEASQGNLVNALA